MITIIFAIKNHYEHELEQKMMNHYTRINISNHTKKLPYKMVIFLYPSTK